MTRRFLEAALSVSIAGAAGWALWESRDYLPNARLFPGVIALPVMALGLFQLTITARQPATGPRDDSPTRITPVGEAEPGEGATFTLGTVEERRRAFEMLCWTFAFFASVVLIGFRVGAPLITLVFLRVASGERWRLSLTLAAGTWLFFVIAEMVLGVPLPGGLLSQVTGLRSLDAYLVDPLVRVVRGQ